MNIDTKYPQSVYSYLKTEALLISREFELVLGEFDLKKSTYPLLLMLISRLDGMDRQLTRQMTIRSMEPGYEQQQTTPASAMQATLHRQGINGFVSAEISVRSP